MKESFKKQHEKLIQIENELKDDLQKKVTLVKDDLTKYLFESEDLIKRGEIFDKYIEYYEKGKEKPIIKTLSYISEIENNNDKVVLFLYKTMGNMEISFKEEKNMLEYNDYNFNGLPEPKKIQSNLDNFYMNISWDIDAFKYIQDINLYQFRIELR